MITFFAKTNQQANLKYFIACMLPLYDTYLEYWLRKIFQACSIKFSLGFTDCETPCFHRYFLCIYNTIHVSEERQGGGKYLVQPK